MRKAILDNYSLTLTYNFIENYTIYKVSPDIIAQIKRQSVKKMPIIRLCVQTNSLRFRQRRSLTAAPYSLRRASALCGVTRTASKRRLSRAAGITDCGESANISHVCDGSPHSAVPSRADNACLRTFNCWLYPVFYQIPFAGFPLARAGRGLCVRGRVSGFECACQVFLYLFSVRPLL